MAVRMGGSLNNIKVPEEIEGEKVMVDKRKAIGVMTGVGSDGSDTITVTADGVKSVAQLVQEQAVFGELQSAVPDPEMADQAGLAHVPATGTDVKVVIAFHAQSIEPLS